jgi:putative ABC transport system substrate-binding protein
MRLISVFIALASVFFLPATAISQHQKPARIGLVSFHSPHMAGHVEQIRQGLRERGWEDGSFVIEAHFTDGDNARTREQIGHFLQDKIDVLVLWTTPAAQMGRELTKTMPVVMISSDPVAAKLVPSLARPGGNMTGVSMSGPDLAGKRLELLREIRPDIRTIAFVGASSSPGAAAFVNETTRAAGAIGMKVLTRLIDSARPIDDAVFEELQSEGAQAVIIQPLFTGRAKEVVAAASKAKLPVIADYPAFAEAGALFTMGVDESERVHRTAYFIDRILKGADPANLPVEQPTKFLLAVNTVTAKSLGWSLPQSILFRADRVIE